MPGDVFTQIGLDFVLIHAGKKVPGAIIVPNMLDAEEEKRAQIVPRLRRTILANALAAGPFASFRRLLFGTRQLKQFIDASSSLAHVGTMARWLFPSKGRARERRRKRQKEAIRRASAILSAVSITSPARSCRALMAKAARWPGDLGRRARIER